MAVARRACAVDLLHRLREAGFGPLALAASEPPESIDLARLDAEWIPVVETPFHFGRVFGRIVESRGFDRLAYFGAASAPLATRDVLVEWRERAQDLPDAGALVNHVHSTDWAILRDARQVSRLADRLPTDNPLGWVLREEAGLPVHAAPATSASRTDIDTPGDLALLRRHPALGPELKQALQSFPAELGARADALAEIVRSPARSLALIGRVSEQAWREIVRRGQVWVRVFAEERGMRASGRLARGEVRSLLAEIVEERGAEAFVAHLAGLVDGAFWDTRVWLAHRGPWPAAADRMAADLGWAEDVEDPALRRLTEAIRTARLPVLTGGQGVVAGSLRAFVEAALPGPSADALT